MAAGARARRRVAIATRDGALCAASEAHGTRIATHMAHMAHGGGVAKGRARAPCAPCALAVLAAAARHSLPRAHALRDVRPRWRLTHTRRVPVPPFVRHRRADALESGNAKQALALCDKALKKQPDALLVKALKANALEYLDRPDESIVVCQEIKSAKPTNRAVLRAVSNVYAAQGRGRSRLTCNARTGHVRRLTPALSHAVVGIEAARGQSTMSSSSTNLAGTLCHRTRSWATKRSWPLLAQGAT